MEWQNAAESHSDNKIALLQQHVDHFAQRKPRKGHVRRSDANNTCLCGSFDGA